MDVKQILMDCLHDSALHLYKVLSEFIQNFSSYHVYRQNDYMHTHKWYHLEVIKNTLLLSSVFSITETITPICVRVCVLP